MEWMIMPLKRYADFEGRSRRTEYWMFQLLILIAVFVLGGLIVATTDFRTEPGSPPPTGFMALIGVFAILWLAIIVPSLAVQVRRFHDQDKSGWFVLLNFVPYIGGIIVLVFMFIEGTRGPNRFGPDPKDPAGTLEAARFGQGGIDAMPRRPDMY